MKQQKKPQSYQKDTDSPKKHGDKLNPHPAESLAQRQGQQQGQQQPQQGQSGQLRRPDEASTTSPADAQVDAGREHLESGDRPE